MFNVTENGPKIHQVYVIILKNENILKEGGTNNSLLYLYCVFSVMFAI